MKLTNRFSIYLMGAILASGTAYAGDDNSQQDAKAIDVLKSMSAYNVSLDRVTITGVTLADARLSEGLLVSNSTEVKVSIDRPGSLRISSFDGKEHKELFFHDGRLTVFNRERGFYAQADIPKEIDAALQFALEELEVEAPLMDLIHRDVSAHLLGSKEPILYLTDQARIAGSDCHHLVIRGPETDVQLWVTEGDRPQPRKIMMTSKWEGGSPRFIANLKWDTDPDFGDDEFKFNPPEGAIDIGFTKSNTVGGE